LERPKFGERKPSKDKNCKRASVPQRITKGCTQKEIPSTSDVGAGGKSWDFGNQKVRGPKKRFVRVSGYKGVMARPVEKLNVNITEKKPGPKKKKESNLSPLVLISGGKMEKGTNDYSKKKITTVKEV